MLLLDEKPTLPIERRAKLFEAGDYPDKGVTVSPADLLRIAGAFTAPVPIWIEHSDSPLELGFVTALRADGPSLFGTLAFSPEAHALVERSGATSLSVGLAPDLSSLREVSLVRHPRVADARLFTQDLLRFDLVFEGAVDYRAALERLLDERRRETAETELRDHVRRGRLTPAQVPFARVLLGTDDALVFDGRATSVRRIFSDLLAAATPARLTEPVAATPEGEEALMLPEEAAFYRRHFPDVNLREIAARRAN